MVLELGLDYTRDGFSLSIALRCCAALGAIRHGKQIHCFMIKNMGTPELHAESAVIDFYIKCGRVFNGRCVFDRMVERDVVTWTIMLRAYADSNGHEDELLRLFNQMLRDGVGPSRHTITSALGGVSLSTGRQLHCLVMKQNWGSDAFIGSALIDMYSRNGVLDDPHLIFERIVDKDIVCFNSLISCYARIGDGGRIISVFGEMGLSGLEANESTYVGMLNGCTNSGLIGLCEQLHALTIVSGFAHNVHVQGVIVDMYAKCGDLNSARATFDKIKGTKTVVTWNSMIGAYGKHGYGEEALHVFSLMEATSVAPDRVTFTCLLSACSHSGLIEEGLTLYESMPDVYEIPRENEHLCCVVDTLGRAGRTREAYEFIKRAGFEAGASVWGALLGACRVWGDTEVGLAASRFLFELEPGSSGSYVGLANVFASNARWHDAFTIREMMSHRGVRKDPGYSWIEIDNQMHKFKSGETTHHPRRAEIYSMCNTLKLCMCDQGLADLKVSLNFPHL
ncbi:Pentatricopeptide repeat-containing protein [Acorus gramineus]|uniref:Pentatricopeptide repeat-containing protein n=1 Tax=Acorus gramineus TaxID=55184 RepID=A0AAV9BNW5_ACOGR|nr:Pentatricopeptide repeat-containing protein [Acorus gramineus]